MKRTIVTPPWLTHPEAEPRLTRGRVTVAAWQRVIARTTVDPDTGCWIYTGRIHRSGYGLIDLPAWEQKPGTKARAAYTHRVFYEYHDGLIPDGLQLDHLCRVRACCNPDHLEPVTHRENSLRGMAPGAVSYRTDTCHLGHSLIGAYTRNGHRRCNECHRRRAREAARRRRAQP